MTKQEALQWAFEYVKYQFQINPSYKFTFIDILAIADQILDWYKKP